MFWENRLLFNLGNNKTSIQKIDWNFFLFGSVFFCFFSGLREISISKMLKNNTSQEVGKAIKKLVKENLILRVPEERRKTYMCIEYYSVSAGNSVKSDFFQHISPSLLA